MYNTHTKLIISKVTIYKSDIFLKSDIDFLFVIDMHI